jgi:hypothetical protein
MIPSVEGNLDHQEGKTIEKSKICVNAIYFLFLLNFMYIICMYENRIINK